MRKRLLADWALRYHALGKPGKIAVVSDEAAQNRRRPLARLLARRRRALPRDQRRSRASRTSTRPRQPRRRRHQRHRRARPRQHRRARRQAGHGGQGQSSSSSSPTSTCSTSRSARETRTIVDIVLPAARADGRRDQPRGHPARPTASTSRRRCGRRCEIPVFHDDQHGTAIISGAALLNALEIVGKQIDEVQVVFSGAGAAAIATAEHYVRLGVRRENILMCDRAGVIYEGRATATWTRTRRASRRRRDARTLAEALAGADVFVGALGRRASSRARWSRTMATDPIIFALANPDPGDPPDEVRAARDRRDHRHRAQRLPEPGQQRPRLPVHLPRRARRARQRKSTRR